MNLLEQLFRVPYVDSETGFDISPDGKSIAFSWNIHGTWEIFISEISGNKQPEQITRGPGGKINPIWSPDGNTLAYMQDLKGSESYHLHLLNLVACKDKDLTEKITYPLHPHFDWTPDGNYLVYISIEKGFYGIYKQSIVDDQIIPICSFKQPLRDICISPNGELLAIEAEAAGTESSIILVPIKTGEKKYLSENGIVLPAMNPSWSPDGSKLVFSSNISGYHDIGIFEIESERIEWLSKGETEDLQPVWSPSGDQLAYIQNQGCSAELIIKAGGQSYSSNLGKGVFYSPKFTPDGTKVLTVYEDPCHPPDIWSFSIEKQELTQLTNSYPDELGSINLVIPEEITYPGLDGESIPALLYQPHLEQEGKGQDQPAIVNIHGGPDWLYQFIWNPFMSYLSSKGWVVLAPNYRGSTGYGREWQKATRFKMGELDAEDIVAGAEFLINKKIADPSRIIVTGRSHGGYLTMMCLIKRPELWAGGSAVVPFLNLFSSHEESRQDLQQWNIENYGDPIENHDRWMAASPYFFLDQIKVPVQLICSTNDVRCPASDAIASHQKLKEMGLSSELIVFPDEGHQLLKIENIVKSYKKQVRYFKRVLNEN
ncbi:S9 family peptidase [Chloroflexota bacterium]